MRRTIKMEDCNRQQFYKFVKTVCKSIKNLKKVKYDGHDRATNELYLVFESEELADKTINKLSKVVEEYGKKSKIQG